MLSGKNLFLFIILLALCSCTRTYYLSPSYGTSMPYHTLPGQNDSVKSSLYLNGSLSLGATNFNLRDNVTSFQVNLYNANTFKNFNIWYGGGLTLGNYRVVRIEDSSFVSYEAINAMAGRKFFGAFNGNAGAAFTIKTGNLGEWRILGAQASLNQEFGDYFNFRQQILKDSVRVNGIAAGKTLGTIGLSTEMLFNANPGNIGIQLQYNTITGKDYKYDNNNRYNSIYPPSGQRYGYWSSTFSYTNNNTSCYLQGNLGTRLMNFQIGLNQRLLYSRGK